jgi:hypothetical protein
VVKEAMSVGMNSGEANVLKVDANWLSNNLDSLFLEQFSLVDKKEYFGQITSSWYSSSGRNFKRANGRVVKSFQVLQC